jgi:DNA-binding protein HU-beta
MNKTELIAAIAEASGLTKADSEKALDALLTAITNALSSGDMVRLIGFGTFCTAKRNAMTGRNVRTGEAISIPASVIPKFKAGEHLKEAVAG